MEKQQNEVRTELKEFRNETRTAQQKASNRYAYWSGGLAVLILVVTVLPKIIDVLKQ